MDASTLQQIVARYAGAQHGVVSRRQLQRSGVSPHIIDRRIRGGLLKRVHRGVFLVGVVEAPLAREMAACLACGEHAFVSRRSAAVMWGIMKRSARPARPEVTLRHGYRRAPGIDIHRPRSLPERDTGRLEGVPITTVPRTLLDLATLLRPRALERAVARAFALRLVDARDLAGFAEERAGQRGARHLRALVLGDGPAHTRSEAEEIFLELIRRAGVDPPEVNSRVVGFEVDFYWPRRQLVVEVDGRAFHTSPRDFESDRTRDAELAAVGIRVVRITWHQLNSTPEAILVRLGGALSASARR